jgi:AraC family transcriptional regulator
MVCDRCIRVVRDELSALGHDVRRVTLGDAEIGTVPTPQQTEAVRAMLERNGFELIEDRNARIIEAVKTAVIRLVHHDHSSSPMKLKYSELLAREVGRDYHALSVLFSSVENITIEQYIIRQRIERVKELIRYDDRSLSEIAFMMRYSSVQHLSSQFKAVTGFTPTAFKSLAPTHRAHQRMPLDKVK